MHIPLRTLCRAAGMSIALPSKDVFSASMPLSARRSAGRQSDERGCWHTQAKSLQDWHLESREQITKGVLFHGDGGKWNAAHVSSTQAALDAAVQQLNFLLQEPNSYLQEALAAQPAEEIASGRQSSSNPLTPSPSPSLKSPSPNLEKQTSSITAERLKCTKDLIWSLALWRRFGTVLFAQRVTWIQVEEDVESQKVALNDLVEAAVCLWMSGDHAVLNGVEPAWHAFATERKAWQIGGNKEQQDRLRELETVKVPTHSTQSSQSTSKRAKEVRGLRRELVTPAGEQAVRKAYQKLLFGRQQEVWDLWRNLDSVAKTALEGDFVSLIDRLSQVKGFDLAAGFMAREVALDLKTMTPLADDAGPVTWSIDYITWLRKRLRINPVAKAKLAAQKAEKDVLTTTTTTVLKAATVTFVKKKKFKSSDRIDLEMQPKGQN